MNKDHIIKQTMTDVKKLIRIYPDLNLLVENTDEWRLKSCFKFEKEIEKDVTKYSSNLSKMKKKLKNLRLASSILTGSATAFSIGGTAISSTVVGVIIGGPIVGIGTIVSIFSLITLKMEKNIFKEIVKYEKLLNLIYSKLSFMREIINKSLKDKEISEKEYKYIEYEFYQYLLMKDDLLTLVSKNQKKELQTKQQNISAKEIVEKLEELLKK